MKQLLEGLAHLAAKDIMHRDLKPANLMLNKQGILKIIDFGWARKLDTSYFTNPYKHHTPRSATPLYRAPEIHFG